LNLIEHNDEGKEFARDEKRDEGEGERERGGLGEERAPEKAAFGLAGLTYSRRYTATNDDVSPLLRKRSSAGTAGAPHSGFYQSWNPAFANRLPIQHPIDALDCTSELELSVINRVIIPLLCLRDALFFVQFCCDKTLSINAGRIIYVFINNINT